MRFYCRMKLRTGFLLLILTAASTHLACSRSLEETRTQTQLKARGVSLAPSGEELIWSLNVGVLNDAELPELSVAAARALTDRAVQLAAPELPGLGVSLILDQPMNSVFLMERAIRALDFFQAKGDPTSRVLRLESGAQADAENQQKLRAAFPTELAARARTAAELARLLNAKSRLGRPCLLEKMPASDYVWRAYMKEQVRYDIVLTNALVYPDDLGEAPEALLPGGAVAWTLQDAPGRTALEGVGALVSVADQSAPECLGGSPVPDELVARRLAEALVRLLRANRPAGGVARRSADWERRKARLRALYAFTEGEGERACPIIRQAALAREEFRAAEERVGGRETRLERAERLNLAAYRAECGKK